MRRLQPRHILTVVITILGALPVGADEPRFPAPANRTDLRATFRLDASAEAMLRRNGFVVLSSVSRPGLRDAYPKDRGHEVPLLVTTDAMLELWFELYRSVLVETEQRRLYPDLAKTVASLHRTAARMRRQASPDARAAVNRAVISLAVADRLLGSAQSPPADLRDEVERRVSQVLAAKETHAFPGEDYTQYRVRGHYVNTPALSRYFRGSMWLSRQVIMVEPSPITQNAPLSTAVALAAIVREDAQARGMLSAVVERRRFLAGAPNSVSPEQLLTALQRVHGPKWNLSLALQPEAVARLRRKLAKPEYPEAHVWTRPTAPGTRFPGKVVALLPDAAVADSRLFQRTMHPSIPGRTLPTTLEVGAGLGWEVARREISNSDARGAQVLAVVDRIKPLVHPREDSLYNGWLRVLGTLQATDPRAPEFMRGGAWQYKSLQTSLAGWTQLRHASRLYAAQPYGGTLSGTFNSPNALVEPAPAFFRTLGALAMRTRAALGVREGLSHGSLSHLRVFETKCRELETAAEAQLAGRLTALQAESLSEFGAWLERFPFLTEPAVVDVATGGDQQVLHAATGAFNPILAIPDPKSGIVYAGWVLSFYELRRPAYARLTDAEWKQALTNRYLPPDRPTWTAHFIAPREDAAAQDRLPLRQAEELFSRKQPAEALALLQRTAAIQPSTALATESQLRIGRYYLEIHDYRRASDELRRCERLYGCTASDLARTALQEAEFQLLPRPSEYEQKVAAFREKARAAIKQLRPTLEAPPSRQREVALLHLLLDGGDVDARADLLSEASAGCRTEVRYVLHYASLAVRSRWAAQGFGEPDTVDKCLAFSRRSTSPALQAGAAALAVEAGMGHEQPEHALGLMLQFRGSGGFPNDPALKLIRTLQERHGSLTLDPEELLTRAAGSVMGVVVALAWQRGDWHRLTFLRDLPATSSEIETLRTLFKQFGDEGGAPLRMFVEANGKEHRAGPAVAAQAFHALSRRHPHSKLAAYALWCAVDCFERAGSKTNGAAVSAELVRRYPESFPAAMVRMRSAIDQWTPQAALPLAERWADAADRPRGVEIYLRLPDPSQLAIEARERIAFLDAMSPLFAPNRGPETLFKLQRTPERDFLEREVERLFPNAGPEIYLTLMKAPDFGRLAGVFLRRYPDHPSAGRAWDMARPDDLSRDLNWLLPLVNRGPSYPWEARAREKLAELVARDGLDSHYREQNLAWNREAAAQVRELSPSSRADLVTLAAAAGALLSASRPEAALELLQDEPGNWSAADPFELERKDLKRRAVLEIAAKQSPEWAPRWTAAIRPPIAGGGAPGQREVTLAQPLCSAGYLLLPATVGNEAPGIAALDEETGLTRWTAPTGAPSGLAADEAGRLFVGAANGSLIALDIRDGRRLFERKIDPLAQSAISVAVDGDYVIAWGAGAVQCFRCSNGEAVWNLPFKPVAGRPAVLGGLAFLATGEGVLSAVELSTGRFAWRHDYSRPGIDHPIVDDPPILAGRRLVFTPADAVMVLDPQSGRLQLSLLRNLATNRYEKVMGGEELAAAALDRMTPTYVRYRRGALTLRPLPGRAAADGVVYGTDGESDLVAFDLDTGAFLRRFEGSVDGSREIVIGRYVYVIDESGKLLAFPRTPRPSVP